jgi:uncharacterized membrane protein YhaH (DUF805 family)
MTTTQLLFSLKGRVSRQPYWLFVWAVLLLVMFPAFLLGIGSERADQYVDIASLVLFWPSLAIQAKRWHDRDKSAWWILINFIPILGFFWALVENGFLEGTSGTNRYGPDPLQSDDEA